MGVVPERNEAETAESEVLLQANAVSLSVPVFQPTDRQLLSSPLKFIADLYLARTSRGVSHLLKDVSLTLRRGERLGVVGVNGAGKSTLLRVLAGIYRPTTGSLESHGDIKGLFDISLGMNPEATGLENIYMRGLQLGFGINQIREFVPGVLEFSELGEAIEKPLNTYSTGMRLLFRPFGRRMYCCWTNGLVPVMHGSGKRSARGWISWSRIPGGWCLPHTTPA